MNRADTRSSVNLDPEEKAVHRLRKGLVGFKEFIIIIFNELTNYILMFYICIISY